MPHTQLTRIIGCHLLCEEESRHFKSNKQRDLFLRLHKKRCEKCKDWSFTNVTQNVRVGTFENIDVMDRCEDLTSALSSLGLNYKPK